MEGVLLNRAGIEIFVGEFLKTLDETVEHSTLKKPVKVGNLMRLEGYKLQKFLLGDDREFRPFSLLERR
jgi:CRISPR/Cas system-associated endonuclease Cas1